MNNDNKCSICTTDFENDDLVINTKCNHNFHWDCNYYRDSRNSFNHILDAEEIIDSDRENDSDIDNDTDNDTDNHNTNHSDSNIASDNENDNEDNSFHQNQDNHRWLDFLNLALHIPFQLFLQLKYQKLRYYQCNQYLAKIPV